MKQIIYRLKFILTIAVCIYCCALAGCERDHDAVVSIKPGEQTAVWTGDCIRPLLNPPPPHSLTIDGCYRIRHALDEALTSRQRDFPREPIATIYVAPVSLSTLRVIAITSPPYTPQQLKFFEDELLKTAQHLYEQEINGLK